MSTSRVPIRNLSGWDVSGGPRRPRRRDCPGRAAESPPSPAPSPTDVLPSSARGSRADSRHGVEFDGGATLRVLGPFLHIVSRYQALALIGVLCLVPVGVARRRHDGQRVRLLKGQVLLRAAGEVVPGHHLVARLPFLPAQRNSVTPSPHNHLADLPRVTKSQKCPSEPWH